VPCYFGFLCAELKFSPLDGNFQKPIFNMFRYELRRVKLRSSSEKERGELAELVIGKDVNKLIAGII